MRIKLFGIALLLVSPINHAAEIKNIEIFYNDTNPVVLDAAVGRNKRISVFNMDLKNNATARLNRLLQQRVSSVQNISDPVITYSEAFDAVLNGKNWDGIYEELEQGSRAIEFAIRYKIKKIPAIVFNESAVIYGVTSVNEAIRIYKTKGDR